MRRSVESVLYRTHEYDEHTGDLTRQVTDRTTGPQRLDDVRYTRDDAGNITSQTTTSGQDAQQTTDRQCYATDALRRLTDAWATTADTCANEPTPATVGGGPEAYWHSYTYDAIGNRTTETQHAVTGTATDQDVTRTYTQPDPGQPRPHSTTKVTTAGGSANGTSETLDYDATGNMTARSGGSADQTYTWDNEGRLATATESGTSTDYVYDTDGNRLLATTSDNTATLYLPEGNELHLNPDGTVSGTRYYAHDGETVAVRSPGSPMHFLVSDHQGTAMLAISLAAGQAIIRRKQLPFGAPRPTTPTGTEPDFPGTKGFVGGTLDDTGLTHIGAREYDPNLGAFISPDPLLDPANPLQANAYAYANNTPVTASDPTGEMLYDEVTKHGYGNNKVRKSWYRKQGYTNSRGHVSSKYRALVRHNTRSFNSYWAQTRAQQARAQEERYRLDSMKRAQLLAAAKAKAEWQKKEKNKTSILGGLSAAWDATGGKLKKRVLDSYFSGDTTGICISGAIGVGYGRSGSLCLLNTSREDGVTDYGISFSHGASDPVVGVSLTGGLMGSNADSFEQIKGQGVGFGVTAGNGPAVSIDYERAVGVSNSRGEPVSSTMLSGGAGIGIEGGIGAEETKVWKLFSVPSW